MGDRDIFPEHWKEAEDLVKDLIKATGPEATKAAVWTLFDAHATNYRHNPSADNYTKLQFIMNAMQVVKNDIKR